MTNPTVGRPKIAICYDFDKTLSPDDMQTFTLIPSFGMKSEDFWRESDQLAKDHLMEKNLAWMFKLIEHSKANGLSINKDYFHQIGAEVELYNGVDTWFDRMNAYADSKGIELEHYIISSGLKEIIEGSSIAHHFKRIYASSYLYSESGDAQWPAQAINYTNKTQFIFRIAKGFLEEHDERVNDSVQAKYIPYENLVYIGDSATDIPCMRLVKSKGGYSIGVFDPEKNIRKKVYQLFGDGRINLYAPADYSEGSDISRLMIRIIDEIAAREAIKAEQRILKADTDAYKSYCSMSAMAATLLPTLPPENAQSLQATLDQLRSQVGGNV
jgi:phosphoserine phosphatase